MNSGNSITLWLQRWKDGCREEALRHLWRRYFHRMMELAYARLRSQPRAHADEEDAALAAFASFVKAAEKGAFPQLNDRDDLWRILFTLTERKSLDLVEKEGTGKRGGGRNVQASALLGDSGTLAWGQEVEPDPADAVAMAESLEQILALLGKQNLRQVAVWKLEGHTNEQMAGFLNCSLATVERKLKTIRAVLSEAGIGPN